jgi:hypothetical protein
MKVLNVGKGGYFVFQNGGYRFFFAGFFLTIHVGDHADKATVGGFLFLFELSFSATGGSH